MARDAAAMSDARLAEIQASVRFVDYGEDNAEADAIHDLLAEVERLRAREAALVARNEQAMAIVQAVAEGGNAEDFRQRSAYLLMYHIYASDEMRQKARALLASTGEAEAGEQA